MGESPEYKRKQQTRVCRKLPEKILSLSKKSRADEDDKIISHREIMHKESLQEGEWMHLQGLGLYVSK